MRTEKYDMTSGHIFVTSKTHKRGRPTKLFALIIIIIFINCKWVVPGGRSHFTYYICSDYEG